MKEHKIKINGIEVRFQRGRDRTVAIFDSTPNPNDPEKPLIAKREIEMVDIRKSIAAVRANKLLFPRKGYDFLMQKMHAALEFGYSIGLN